MAGAVAAMDGHRNNSNRGPRPFPPSNRQQQLQQQQSRPGPSNPQRPPLEPVDREKTCPLLLRVFTKTGGHHSGEDFAVRGKEPRDEVQIYTWKDATLRELTDLVKEVAPEARRREAKLSFAFVFPDKYGRFVVSPVGMTHVYGNRGKLDDGNALGELDFQIGDYLDVAIL
ncbi:Histone deacetylase complex subunit SAP18 [Acorus calamus]|uniref:Histone deacetylase complex subunit SAP18 n=1 Tax=Acorus calamus TaxID=4465 RepID=A0AAV9FH93_ACOCL|nr:Histone deacetylase complex subunit SAP18 [Acorus calamus]